MSRHIAIALETNVNIISEFHKPEAAVNRRALLMNEKYN